MMSTDVKLQNIAVSIWFMSVIGCILILLLDLGVAEGIGRLDTKVNAINLKLDMIEKHLDMVHPDE